MHKPILKEAFLRKNRRESLGRKATYTKLASSVMGKLNALLIGQ